MVYFKHFLVFLMLLGSNVKAQDTIFNRSLNLPLYAENVTSDGNTLFIRSSDSIFSWDNFKLEFIALGNLNYSWLNSRNQKEISFTHSEHIPKSNLVNSQFSPFLPGVYNGKISSARIKDKLYISFNGNILEYQIYSHLQRFLKGTSVRHIYIEPGITQVISTYDGIFVDLLVGDNEIQLNRKSYQSPIPGYAGGSFNKIGNKYFLCQDDLLEFNMESKSLDIRMNTEGQARFRQLFEFNNEVFALMTVGVNKLDVKNFEFEDILFQNEEITGYVILNDEVVFSSYEKGLYTLDTTYKIRNIGAPRNINAIIDYHENLLLCTDKGLYEFNIESGTYKRITNKRYLHTIVKYKNGVIFSGNRGLYWYDGTNVTSIIEDIEFNKLGLTIGYNCLYAGSINGLYYITSSDLLYLTEESKTEIQEKSISLNETRSSYLIWILGFLILGGVIIYMIFKINRKETTKPTTNKEITVANVKLAVHQNESIKSVGHIASYFNTSVSQVNRRLALENTSPLECLKEAKSEIVIQMNQDGKTIEEISKRVGYSKRYIRENFLN